MGTGTGEARDIRVARRKVTAQILSEPFKARNGAWVIVCHRHFLSQVFVLGPRPQNA